MIDAPPQTECPPAPTLTVVVPLYRSAATVRPLVEALESLAVEGGHEIVLVHDGSPDDTLEAARQVVRGARRVPIKLVDHARNFGEHNAVLTGLRHARGRWIVTMDDDLQNPPEEVLRLLAHARSHDLDCVYGRYRTKAHSWFRNLGSRFTNWVSCFVLDKPPGLYLSSFRCLSAFLAREICRHDGPFPYIDGLILQATARIGSVEVRHEPRREGRSGYTLRKLVRLWMSMFINFSVLPLRLATVAGLLLGAAGGVVLVVVLVEYLFFGVPVRGWGSLMAGLAVFSGTQLIMLGLIGEYLGRVFLTLNRRPQAVVRAVEVGGPGARR